MICNIDTWQNIVLQIQFNHHLNIINMINLKQLNNNNLIN